MSIIGRITNLFRTRSPTATRYELVTERGNGFYCWNGSIYHSDIVRACMRPRAIAIGKLTAKHIRESIDADEKKTLAINPDPYMRFLLSDPNPYMSMQKLLEKMSNHLDLNQNAFALIVRDDNGLPIEVYPLNVTSYEAKYDEQGNLFIEFTFPNGKTFIFDYRDIIHLREDFNDNDVFGSSASAALTQLMDIVKTSDKSIIDAVKNSAVIKWLMKIPTALRPDDVKKKATEFAEAYLSTERKGLGVAAVDASADVEQVKATDYVPNFKQSESIVNRIYALFGTNEKIVTSSYDENEWNSYYELKVEPVAISLADEFTRKLFTRRERGCGNSIRFDAANLTTTSMSTKLQLVQFVDRGMMTPNEVREILNLGPIDGGDRPIRRLDTAVVEEGGNSSNDNS